MKGVSSDLWIKYHCSVIKDSGEGEFAQSTDMVLLFGTKEPTVAPWGEKKQMVFQVTKSRRIFPFCFLKEH